MTATLFDVIQVIERLAPPGLAEKWDNVGLQVGQKSWPIKSIWVALDPLPEVVSSACQNGIDLIVTHHPLIFSPLKSIDFEKSIGSIIQMAAMHRTAIYSMHTNLDRVPGGVNDVLAERLSLKNLKVLEPSVESEDVGSSNYTLSAGEEALSGEQRTGNLKGKVGLGRIGELERPINLIDFAKQIKKKMGLKALKVAGAPELTIHRAALCAGSGGSMMKPFFESGAQVYISGDLRYHDARAAEAENLGLIDIGHFPSEYLMVDALSDRLAGMFNQAGMDVAIEACRLESDPFEVV